VALFVCTGMIYACLRFLAEWAHPLTPLNFVLMGAGLGLHAGRRAGRGMAPALRALLPAGRSC
jgi:DMSO reductase anchor subunit